MTALDLPSGVGVDPLGNVLIADTGDNEIEVLAENGATPPYDLHGASWVVGDLYVLAGGQTDVLNQPAAVTPFVEGGVFGGDLVVADTADDEVDLLASSVTNPGFGTLSSTLVAGTLYPVVGGSGGS